MKITERRLRSIIRNVIKESKDLLDPNAIGEWMEVDDDDIDEEVKKCLELLECDLASLCYLDVYDFKDLENFANQEGISLNIKKIVQIGRNNCKYVVVEPFMSPTPFIFTDNYLFKVNTFVYLDSTQKNASKHYEYINRKH